MELKKDIELEMFDYNSLLFDNYFKQVLNNAIEEQEKNPYHGFIDSEIKESPNRTYYLI